MSAQGNAIDRWSERLNPIVVKEVRQGLRTRVFWVFFGLMLLACLCISLVAWASAGRSLESGKEFFLAYFGCLSVVQFFVIPYTAYRSMAREREDETWVLLTLTGLGPRRILRGKLFSFAVQGILYGSAAGPFLVFSYYLNGIDLPTILLAVVLGAAYQVFLTSVSVSIATLAESRIVRGLLHFVLLGLLLWSLGSGIGGAVGLTEITRTWWSEPAALPLACGVLFAMVTTAWLLFEASAARLSLPTESYAKGPRLVFLLQLIGLAAIIAIGWHSTGHDRDVLIAAQMASCLYLAVVGLFIATDHDGMARAQWLSGGQLSLFKPGALRGFIVVMLCLAGVTALWCGLYVTLKVQHRNELRAMLGAPMMVALYLSAASVLARLFSRHPSQTPLLTRVLWLGLVGFGTGLPPLLAVLSGADADTAGLNLLNPFVGLYNIGRNSGSGSGGFGLGVLLVAAGLAVPLALGVLVAHDKRGQQERSS